MKHILTALFILGLATPALAADLFVSPSGNDNVSRAANSATNPWRTLGRAIWGTTNRNARNGAEAARGGDVVYVTGDHTAPGSNRRNEPAFFVENSGTAGNPLVIRAVGVSRLSLSSGTGPIAGVLSRNYITWEGFTVVESATSRSTPDTGPVVLWDCQYCEIRKFDIDANGVGHGVADNHPGIRIESTLGAVVADTRVRNVRTASSNAHNGACIQTYASGALTIEHNDLSDCGAGVFIKGGPARYPDTGVTIRQNDIHHIVGGSGIALHAGAIGTAAHPVSITGNVVRDSDVPATKIWGFSTDPLNTPMHVRIIGNTFVGVRSGLLLNGAPPLTNAGHVFERNITVPTYLPIEWDSPTMQPATAIRSGSNLAPSATWATVTSGARYTLAQWQNASGQEVGSVQADPGFVNATDYRLTPTSPARALNAGAYVTGAEVVGPRSGTPPTPVDCVGTWGTWTRVAGSETACVGGSRTFIESRLFTVVTPPSNGGAACPASPESRTQTEACTAPPTTMTCTVRGNPAPYADGDIRLTVRCDTNGPVRVPVGTAFTLPRPQ